MKYTETTIIDKDYSTITFDQLAKHLNLDDDLVNSEYLESILKASIDWIETRINSFITPTILENTFYDFSGSNLELEYSGINSISSVKVNDVEITGYKVIKKQSSTVVLLDTAIPVLSKISVTFSAGEQPKYNYLQATLINAADMFDVDRSNYSSGLTNNRTVMRLLNLE